MELEDNIKNLFKDRYGNKQGNFHLNIYFKRKIADENDWAFSAILCSDELDENNMPVKCSKQVYGNTLERCIEKIHDEQEKGFSFERNNEEPAFFSIIETTKN